MLLPALYAIISCHNIMSSEEATTKAVTKPHQNDNVEILYKPYIKVWSDYKGDVTPKRKNHKEHIATPSVAS